MVTAPPGCADPGRWLDAYLIADAHRAERGLCRCGRPLPCIAAERAAEIMTETTRAAREAAAAAEAQRAVSRAITQELPVIRIEPSKEEMPVGARFPRQRRRDPEETTSTWAARSGASGVNEIIGAAPESTQPTGTTVPRPADVVPVGARFPRERRSRHRA